MPRRSARSLALLLLLLPFVAGLVEAPDPFGPRLEEVPSPDPFGAQLLGSNDRWLVWRLVEQRGDLRQFRNSTLRVRICRQRIGASSAQVVSETLGGRAQGLVGVFLDGSLLLQEGGSVLRMIDPDGESRNLSFELPENEQLLGYSGAIEEGIFVQSVPKNGAKIVSTRFVPFREGGLDIGAAVLVGGPADGKGAQRRVGSVARHGAEVVWCNGELLVMFDLRSGTRRKVKLEGTSDRSDVVAFDGRFVVTQEAVWDLQGGPRPISSGYKNYRNATVLRDGVLTRLDLAIRLGAESSLTLLAVDLLRNPKQVRKLKTMRVPADIAAGTGVKRPPLAPANMAMFATDSGLLLFDGQAWVVEPYPDPASGAAKN